MMRALGLIIWSPLLQRFASWRALVGFKPTFILFTFEDRLLGVNFATTFIANAIAFCFGFHFDLLTKFGFNIKKDFFKLLVTRRGVLFDEGEKSKDNVQILPIKFKLKTFSFHKVDFHFFLRLGAISLRNFL